MSRVSLTDPEKTVRALLKALAGILAIYSADGIPRSAAELERIHTSVAVALRLLLSDAHRDAVEAYQREIRQQSDAIDSTPSEGA